MPTIFNLLYLLLYLTPIFCMAQNIPGAIKPTSIRKSIEINNRVEKLLSQMTLEEKIGQMNQYNGFWDFTGPSPETGSAEDKYEDLKAGRVGSMLNVRGVENIRAIQKVVVEESRLGIPLIFGFDVIHGYQTTFPIPLAEAASWDLEAIQESARIAAIEASAAGLNWTFAPNVDLVRDARWGRVMEGAGEDPYLASKIAVARVKGFQGIDLSAENTIAATAKHFAGYGFVEAGLEYNKSDVDMLTLYNQILPPFKAAVEEANVKTVMSGFNEINGKPVTGNQFLLRKILKEKWNFMGPVISDWASIAEIAIWGAAENYKDAARVAIEAGCDIDMEAYCYIKFLKELINEGKISEELIDDAVGRILRIKFELGIMDDPYKYCDANKEKQLIGHPDHHKSALEIAKKSIVLLKNENNLLPLKKEGLNIAVIGELAADKNSPLGSWRLASEDHSAISLIEGMQKYPGNKMNYIHGPKVFLGETKFIHEVEINQSDKSGITEAVEIAKKADVVILNLGEHGFQSGEARSRTNLQLPGLQQELMEAIFAVNKHVVLVLQNGRPLALTWADEHIPAIVEAWQLGSQSGQAIAKVLYGDYNPSGKLPMSVPQNVGQCPIYYNRKNTGRPRTHKFDNGLVFWSHYMDVDRSPLYPFGYGLSYSTFQYDDFKLSSKIIKKGEKIKASIRIKNTSEIKGKEVVQLYIRDVAASFTRPIKELKGFQLVELNPGESKTVEFELGEKELGYYDDNGNYLAELGTFQVFIGGSSDVEQVLEFRLEDE